MTLMKVNQYWEKDYTELLEENKLYQVRQQNLEDKVRTLELENNSMKQQLSCPQNLYLGHSIINRTLSHPLYSVDDIEALKQQLVIFKEDFLQERSDHVTLKNQYSQYKLELQKEKELAEKLTKKCETMKENYQRLLVEKDNILNELRRLQSCHKETRPYPTPINYRQSFSHPKEEISLYSNVYSDKVNPVNFYGGVVERDSPRDEENKISTTISK